MLWYNLVYVYTVITKHAAIAEHHSFPGTCGDTVKAEALHDPFHLVIPRVQCQKLYQQPRNQLVAITAMRHHQSEIEHRLQICSFVVKKRGPTEGKPQLNSFRSKSACALSMTRLEPSLSVCYSVNPWPAGEGKTLPTFYTRLQALQLTLLAKRI